MTGNELKGDHAVLLGVILNKCAWFRIGYIEPSQEKLLSWYNEAAKRSVCIRTLNYYLRRLEDMGLLERIRRTKDMGVFGRQFDTTIYVVLKEGLHALHRVGIKAFEIVKKISEVLRPRKKRARRVARHRTRNGEIRPLGEISGEVLKGFKGP